MCYNRAGMPGSRPRSRSRPGRGQSRALADRRAGHEWAHNPLAHGHGAEAGVAGRCQEMVERLAARNACLFPPKDEWGSPAPELVEKYQRLGLVWGGAPHVVRYSVAYDPEEFKCEADQLVADAGVDLRFHRWAVGVVKDGGRISHVVFESKAGREAIACGAVIDCTATPTSQCSRGGCRSERVHPGLWFEPRT